MSKPVDRFSRPVRRFLLTAHVVFSVAWIGIDVVLIALGITGATTGDRGVMRATYLVLDRLWPIPIVPISIGALVTGIAVGVGTRWGLLLHHWVRVKLVINIALTAATVFALGGLLREAAARASTASTPSDLGGVRISILSAATVSTVSLLVATALSIYKPWGPTRRGRRRRATTTPTPVGTSG